MTIVKKKLLEFVTSVGEYTLYIYSYCIHYLMYICMYSLIPPSFSLFLVIVWILICVKTVNCFPSTFMKRLTFS